MVLRFTTNGGTAVESLALQNIQARTRMALSYFLGQLLPWSVAKKQGKNERRKRKKRRRREEEEKREGEGRRRRRREERKEERREGEKRRRRNAQIIFIKRKNNGTKTDYSRSFECG